MRPSHYLIFFLFLISSCTNNKVVDTKYDLSEVGWTYEEIPAFEFRIDDTTVNYKAFVNIRINENFKYRNIYLMIHLRDPDGYDIRNGINVELSSPEGRWMGSGSGFYKTFQLPISEEMRFSKTGRYIIGIEQNMRDSILSDIQHIGIAIQKGDPVF